jgi:uncharacterized protein (DUF983 family)
MADWRRHLGAILWQRCPRCLTGRVFAGSVRMHPVCPVCGLRFEREQGYFLGAMYVSYVLASAVLGVLLLLVSTYLMPDWRLEAALGVAVVPFLFLVPALYRYSRVVWMHFDRWADPTPEPTHRPPGGGSAGLPAG